MDKTLITLDNFINELDAGSVNDYLFKIERKNFFYTQDCPAFQVDFEYKKVAYVKQFASWLELQSVLAQKTRSWEEITEVWHIEKETMKLIWSKEKGWLQEK